MKNKIISMEEAMDLIKDGDTIWVNSFGGCASPVDLNKAITYGVQCRPYLPGTVDDCSPYLTLSIYDTEAPEPIQVHTHLIGSYNAINCLAAATVGRFFGVSIDEVGKAIESYEPQNMRSQLVDLGYGNQLIMDAYNANATSMHAALSSFKMNNAPHKSVILGDMRELGDESQKEHGNVLNYLFTSGIELDMIVLVGEEFCKAFKTWGMTYAKQHPMNVRCFDNVQDLIDDGSTLGNMGGTILVKGSRSMQLEKAAEAIKNFFNHHELSN